MARLNDLLSTPDTVIQKIVDTCIAECETCRESVADVRAEHPTATLLWAALCEEHLPWARAYVDRPEGTWPGFLPYLRSHITRLEKRREEILAAIDAQKRIDDGLTFVRSNNIEGERLLRAMARIEQLQNCKATVDCELDLNSLKYRLKEYDFMLDAAQVALERATRRLPA